MSRPLFLVLAYNQERYIAQSVKAAFAQTGIELDILISDDCSSDGTFEVIKGTSGVKLLMEITGKIIECIPVKSGQSSNGEWRKQEFVLQTDGQYPKKICFMAWGKKIEQFAIQQGETVQVSIGLESREYNGRLVHRRKGLEGVQRWV